MADHPRPTGGLKVRGIDLLTLLKVTTLHDDELSDLDRALQGLATTSPFHLRSDKDELRTIIAYLDYLAVHGRSPFKARFDGTDRWLKRLNISRSLRASRARRLAADDRVVY